MIIFLVWNYRKQIEDMTLIEEYLDNISKMQLSLDDYADKRKVRKSNKLAGRNIKIAECINTQEELKEQFVCLLNSDDRQVRGWVAHHVIERMTYDKATRQKALRVIEDDAVNNPDSVFRLGTKMWLKDYYSAHPEDRLSE